MRTKSKKSKSKTINKSSTIKNNTRDITISVRGTTEKQRVTALNIKQIFNKSQPRMLGFNPYQSVIQIPSQPLHNNSQNNNNNLQNQFASEIVNRVAAVVKAVKAVKEVKTMTSQGFQTDISSSQFSDVIIPSNNPIFDDTANQSLNSMAKTKVQTPLLQTPISQTKIQNTPSSGISKLSAARVLHPCV